MRNYLIIFLALMFITACTTDQSNTNEQQVHDGAGAPSEPLFPPYKGPKLTIAVLGEQPDIQEKKKVHFKELSLTELGNLNTQNYDAVFVMKENLRKAAKPPFVKMAKVKKIPFFYIDSDKAYYVYRNKDVSYEEASKQKLEYARGYFYEENTYHGFSLFNDEETEESVKDVYSRIFRKIYNY